MTAPHADRAAALLLIDVINPFDFPEAEALAAEVEGMRVPTRDLATRWRRAHAPVIYVNDNFGRWRSDFAETARASRHGRGARLAQDLHPQPDDYFVLKPHRSGFYLTPLSLLLDQLEVGRLVLCGITTDMCVLATAQDACMRGLPTVVVRDGTASFDRARHERALAVIEQSLQCELVAAADVAP